LDKTILIEYADMKEEIKDLRRRMQEDEKKLEQLNNSIVTDSVTCGKKGKRPLRTVKIQGAPNMAIERLEGRLENRRRKMELFQIELLEKQTKVEEYIEQIEKSEIRTMFRLYYIDNMTWYKVAHQMNLMFPKRRKAYTDENCRQRHKRFLDNLENVTPCHAN